MAKKKGATVTVQKPAQVVKKNRAQGETWSDFKEILARIEGMKRSKTVAGYCDMDLGDICSNSMDIDCVGAKIVAGLERLFKCSVYNWDIHARAGFYDLVTKFYSAAEKFNQKMKDLNAREASISRKTMNDIEEIYKSVKYSSMFEAISKRNRKRSEARSAYGK